MDSLDEKHKQHLDHRKARLCFNKSQIGIDMLMAMVGKASLIARRFDKIRFNLDIIIQKKGCPYHIRPPFGNPDFRCNLVFTDAKGEICVDSPLDKDTVFMEIYEKKAYPMVESVSPYRIYKMISKGYEIVNRDDFPWSIYHSENDDVKCDICKIAFTTLIFVCKKCQKKKVYHSECFRDLDKVCC